MSDSATADRRRALVLGALATLLYLLTAPAIPNADGLGYLKLIPHNFAAGHLLYMPLLRLAARLAGGNGLEAGRLANAVLGGSGVVLFFGIARRMAGDAGLLAADARFAATVAAAGLALSYGYWVQGSDVEAYAAAMVALLATVRMVLAWEQRPTILRAVAVGVALGIAVLFHLTHVCLSLLVAWALGFHALIALALGGAIALGGYAYAALVVRGHDLAGAVQWVATAQHGFHSTGGVYRLSDAVVGIAKSLIWSPYAYEADAQKLIGHFLLGLVPLLLLFARRLPQLDGRWLLAWLAPYSLLGILYFGNDSERWLFVLPIGWLMAGLRLSGRTRMAALMLVYIGGLNFATVIWPAHRDTLTRQKAEAVAAQLQDGDTVIFPGHSWDEYIGFYARAKIYSMPLAYYAARDGVDEGWQRFEREVAAAMMRGGRVYAVRIFEDDGDRRGWQELEQLGLTREKVRARMTEGLSPIGAGVVRLDPNL